MECLFTEIESNGTNMYVVIIFRTSDADVRNLCDYLVDILENLKPHNQRCYLMGYYNIDLLKHSGYNPTAEFLGLMLSGSLYPPLKYETTRNT